MAAFEFKYSFLDLARKLGEGTVGEPIEDQWHAFPEEYHHVVTQRTTTGHMITEEYPTSSGNWRPAQFYLDEQARPKAKAAAEGVII